MQRSFSHHNTGTLVLLFVLLVVYEVLSTIYLFLPPLLGLAFLLFIYAVEHDRLDYLLFTIAYLFVFETDREFLLFSSLFYFSIAYRIGVERLRLIVSCHKCMDYLSIALAYLGFWFFSIILNQIIWLDLPQFDWKIFYYIFIESVLVTLL